MTFVKKQIPWNKNTKGIMKPNKTSFKKGSIPWNKELKGIHLSPKSEFKKGQKPATWKPIDTITQRRDKYGTIRKWIKIKEPKVWIEYAKYLWIKKYGKIPKGIILHHKNLNSLDDRIENLMLTSRKEHPFLHNKWNTKNKRISKEEWKKSRKPNFKGQTSDTIGKP